MENKPKTLYTCVFGCRAYIFLSIEICANKLTPYSELIIFIGYKNNGYHFIYYIQENTIFYSIYAIFDVGVSPKCTNPYTKEHKLYDELLDKTSLTLLEKIDLLQYLFYLHSFLLSKNNSSTHSLLSSLFYKFIFPPLTPGPKKPAVEIEETNNVNSDIEMQLSSPQWPLQPSLQTLQEEPKLRRSKH